MTDLNPNLETRWLPIRNDAGEGIPAYAVVEPTEVITTDRRRFQTVVKPTENSKSGLMLNGPFPIGKDLFGTATRDFPNFALFDTDDGTPINGEVWGSVGGSFKLGIGQAGFQIIGGAGNGIVEVIEPGSLIEECGDLLAGFTPNQERTNEPQDAGTAVVTLRVDNHPSTSGTNLVKRVPGFVNKFAWRLNFTSGGGLNSMLWADDSPDFLDVTQDLSIRLVVKFTDLAYATTKFLWDMRGKLIMKVVDDGGEKFRIEAFNGTSSELFTFSGLTIEEDLWYCVYLKYKRTNKTLSLSVTKLEDPVEATRAVLAPFQNFVMTAAISDDNTPFNLGFFVGDSSAGSNEGMRGFMDGLLHWQKNLPLCQIESDFNDGLLRVLPTANPFFDGEGKIHHRDFTGYVETTDATLTNLIFIPIPDETAVCVQSTIVAKRTNGTEVGCFHRMALFERSAGGPAILTGTNLISSIQNIGGTIATGAAVSGNNGIITVTGRAARDINWHGEAFIMPAM